VRFVRASLVRVGADIVLVNAAWLLAHAVRLVFLVLATSQTAAIKSLMRLAFRSYLTTSVILTPLALLVFYASGFYTYGRAYRGRYKALIVLQAVTLVYVLVGFLSYLRAIPPIPRGVWIGGWVLTLGAVGGARLFSAFWSGIVRWEERVLRTNAVAPIRRVLVIGGAGYVGSALVRQLLGRGYRVRVLDALLYGDHAMAELQSHPHFEFVQGDFRNVEVVVRGMQDVDCVVHLGAIVGDPAGDLEPEVTLEINVAATRLIAEVARGFGVRRLIFTSTCSVYGASDFFLDERSTTHAVSLYAKSKLASEQILLKMTDRTFSPVILRLGTLYGLSDRPRFDLVVNILAAKAVLDKEITVVDGEQWRPFVHVEDAARAIVRCLEAPTEQIAAEIFNVGSTRENYQLQHVVNLVCELVPGTAVTRVDREDERRNYRVSCDKIEQRLGFKPTRSLRDGIQEIKAAIERGDILDYAADEYSNYKHLARTGSTLGRTMPSPLEQSRGRKVALPD
jgi:nucleoside-diphosphate-sugar epimerase